MTTLHIAKSDKRYRILIWAFLSYLLLLLMSYGFPVTGDDWTFSPDRLGSYTVLDPFVRGYEISLHHYETTNGRLLGNFLVTFVCFSKVVRELIRCGVILLILFFVYRLSGCRGLSSWLACFAFLIVIPAKIVSQTYTWAAGFFNYVPPTLLFLLYISFVRRIFCEDLHRRKAAWVIALFLLGFLSQFFLENFTLGFCVLSCAVFVTDWIRSKHPDLSLAAHLFGAVAGCVVMFKAPGYQNVGVVDYRRIVNSLEDLLEVMQENFKTLSSFLTGNNLLVIVPLCLCGIFTCLRALRDDPSVKRIPAQACILCFAGYPLICKGIATFGRYLFPLDFFANLGFFTAIILTAVFCVRNQQARFNLIICAGCFLIFIGPLMLVSPVGARNAYFFDVLLIMITMTLFRQVTADRSELKLLAPALALASLLLLAGNMRIHFRNGQTEQLRKQIITDAMDRGDREITIPSYPYPNYIHGESQIHAIGRYYYYEKEGDITFTFVSYKTWSEINVK